MRTSSLTIGFFFAVILLASAPAGAGEATFRSPEDALTQGVSAYKGGYYELAIPALEFAAAKNLFLGRYYLACLYADNTSAYTDHAKAYLLFQSIADEHADADPDDDQRAPYVGKALTALAGYVRRGLAEVNLKADTARAAEYLRYAALFFRDEDAQFELAKLQLKGEGVEPDVGNAKHWLSVLSQKGHPGAQAFLADLYWRGLYTQKDQVRALALITVATANAPPSERVWIEDIYQNIFCGTSAGTRKQATGMVAEWQDRYGRKPEIHERAGLGLLNPSPVRMCHDGEPVLPGSGIIASGSTDAAIADGSAAAALAPQPGGSVHTFVQGSAASSGLRDIGTTLPLGSTAR